MVESWGPSRGSCVREKISHESMATWGPGHRMAKRADSFFPSRKREEAIQKVTLKKKKKKTTSEDQSPWWRSSKFSKLRRVEGLPQRQVGRSGATIPSSGTSNQGHEGLLAQKFQRKPEERPRVDVLDNGLKSDLLRGREKREVFILSHETCVKRRDEARRAEDAAREAGHIFKISVERFLAAKEVEEARSKEVSEKVWQASQSNHKKERKLGSGPQQLVAGDEELRVGKG